MQTLGWIFDCDAKGCRARTVSYSKDVTSAYIKAAREGWMFNEELLSGRRRVFCPEHVADAKTPAQTR